MTNKARSTKPAKAAATQAATAAVTATQPAGASVPVVVQGQPVAAAGVAGLTEDQKTALQRSREAEFQANENSLAQRVSDSGYWWVQDNGAHEQYIGQRPEAMDDPRLAKTIQLNPLMTLRNFDGREVRTDKEKFIIQGDILSVDQIRTPDGEALIGGVDKKKSAERRKLAEARWAEEDKA